MEFGSLIEGCTGFSGSSLVQMPHCWKSLATARLCPISLSNAGYILGYREAFEMFDENGDGTLCVKELMQIMMCVGYNPTDEDMPHYIEMLDKNSKFLCIF